MAPQQTPSDIFLHGTPTAWVIQAGGISSVLVAPSVVLIAFIFWLRRVSLGHWAWVLCALPALVAFAEFVREVHRIAADIGQVWARDWNFAELFTAAYARLYFGSFFTVLFLLFVTVIRVRHHFRHAPANTQPTVAEPCDPVNGSCK